MKDIYFWVVAGYSEKGFFRKFKSRKNNPFVPVLGLGIEFAYRFEDEKSAEAVALLTNGKVCKARKSDFVSDSANFQSFVFNGEVKKVKIGDELSVSDIEKASNYFENVEGVLINGEFKKMIK